jgi:hypothetical protein
MPQDVINQIRGLIQNTEAASKPSAQRSPPARVESVAKKPRMTTAPPADNDPLPQRKLSRLSLIGSNVLRYQCLRNDLYPQESLPLWIFQTATRMNSLLGAARQARVRAVKHQAKGVCLK